MNSLRKVTRSSRVVREALASGRRHGAFTLLELLVVVGIIALMLAILMPSIVNARRQAQRVTCQTQARQLVVGWHQLLDASRGLFPRGATMSMGYGGKQGRSTEYQQPKPLNKYLGMPEVIRSGAEAFHCPNDREALIEDNSTKIRASYFDYYGTSYKANRILVGTELLISPLDTCKSILETLNAQTKGLNRSQIYDESRVILLGDFGWEDAWNVASSNRIEWHGRAGWHNIGFMDGHADFTPIYKGIYVDDRYTVIPFKTLQREAARLQPKH